MILSFSIRGRDVFYILVRRNKQPSSFDPKGVSPLGKCGDKTFNEVSNCGKGKKSYRFWMSKEKLSSTQVVV